MDTLVHLAEGFATSLSLLNIMIVLIGVTAGLFIGTMPGLGSVNGVAIVLPLTFVVPPSSAIILLAAIYYGAIMAARRMPFTVLCAMVLVLCLVAGYGPSQKMHDVWLIAGFGVVGYLLRKADYPMAPLVLALVLGPLMESSFRQTLIAEQGNVLAFFERPLSGTFMALAALFFVLPLLKHLRGTARAKVKPAD